MGFLKSVLNLFQGKRNSRDEQLTYSKVLQVALESRGIHEDIDFIERLMNSQKRDLKIETSTQRNLLKSNLAEIERVDKELYAFHLSVSMVSREGKLSVELGPFVALGVQYAVASIIAEKHRRMEYALKIGERVGLGELKAPMHPLNEMLILYRD